MPLQIQCTCGQVYQLAEEMAGKQIRCQACNVVFLVPGSQAPAPSPQIPSALQNQNPQPNANAPQTGMPQAGVPPQQQQHQLPMQQPSQQPLQTPAQYPPQQPLGVYPSHPYTQGQPRAAGVSPKTYWIIGGSIGGGLLLIIIFAMLMSGSNDARSRQVRGNPKAYKSSIRKQKTSKDDSKDESTQKKAPRVYGNTAKPEAVGGFDVLEHNRREAAKVYPPFWPRLLASGFAAVSGAFLLILGINDFVTKKAEEYGKARATNELFGWSNTYEGRKAEWVGVSRMAIGGLLIIGAIYFFIFGIG